MLGWGREKQPTTGAYRAREHLRGQAVISAGRAPKGIGEGAQRWPAGYGLRMAASYPRACKNAASPGDGPHRWAEEGAADGTGPGPPRGPGGITGSLCDSCRRRHSPLDFVVGDSKMESSRIHTARSELFPFHLVRASRVTAAEDSRGTKPLWMPALPPGGPDPSTRHCKLSLTALSQPDENWEVTSGGGRARSAVWGGSGPLWSGAPLGGERKEEIHRARRAPPQGSAVWGPERKVSFRSSARPFVHRFAASQLLAPRTQDTGGQAGRPGR